MANDKQTALHGWHIGHGANMASFGGYDMPLWYRTGAKAEHLAVIQAAGIFDTSHMAAISVVGPGARGLLQHCFSKDLDRCLGPRKTPLVDGRCVYGIFLNQDGTVIDDAIVYQLQTERFMVVVNAGMGGAVSVHLKGQAGLQEVVVTDLTDRLGKMDVQGPQAARLLTKILAEPARAFDRLFYFAFRGACGDLASGEPVRLVDGSELLLSRTGYTGEFGFELFVPVDRLVPLWERVIAAGAELGAIACGLAARDSLRAGAVLPLSHQDIGPWPFANNPWLFALPLSDDHGSFSKGFIGADSLLQRNWDKHTLAFAGYDPRKIAAGEESAVLSEQGEPLGRVLTCTTDMAIDRVDGTIVSVAGDSRLRARGLCCGLVLVDRPLEPGRKVVLSDGKRKITVEIRTDVRPNRTARAAIDAMWR